MKPFGEKVTVTRSNEDVLVDLVEQITRSLQAGGSVDLEAYVAQYPEHAQRLHRLLPTMEVLRDLDGSKEVGGAEE